MPKPNTMDDLWAEIEEELRQYLIDNGLVDGQNIVPGVKDRDPTAKEFLDYWCPIITAKIKEVDRAARIEELEDIKGKYMGTAWNTQLHYNDPHGISNPAKIIEDRLAELRKDSNSTKDSLKGGDDE